MFAALKRINKNSLFWWILLWVQGAAGFLAYKAGVFEQIYHGDATHITLGIMLLHVLTTLKIGLDTFKSKKDHLEYIWTACESSMTLGMIGTAIGFIIMMTTAFGHGLPTTPQAIQNVLGQMVIGLGTALWTTACGLSSFLLLRIQFTNLEQT